MANDPKKDVDISEALTTDPAQGGVECLPSELSLSLKKIALVLDASVGARVRKDSPLRQKCDVTVVQQHHVPPPFDEVLVRSDSIKISDLLNEDGTLKSTQPINDALSNIIEKLISDIIEQETEMLQSIPQNQPYLYIVRDYEFIPAADHEEDSLRFMVFAHMTLLSEPHTLLTLQDIKEMHKAPDADEDASPKESTDGEAV